MTNAELHWLVGLLEGEGSFCARLDHRTTGSRPQARIQLKMTDKDVVDRAAGLVGGPSVHSYPRPDHSEWTTTWEWVVVGAPAAQLMRRLRPLMGERRQAKIAEILAMDLSHHPRKA